jgi:uncharacterized protein involved in type VI secretion and phage assembly
MTVIAGPQLVRKIHGLLVGLVKDNSDPEGIYRVQVTYAVPSGDILSHWARVTGRMVGPERGFSCLPEPDDEVLLRFVNGHPNQPVVIGSVHGGADKPPFDNADGNNDERILWSRNLHKITFNDKDGAEHITVETTDGKTLVEMKSADKLINFEVKKDFNIVVTNGTLTVEAGGDIELAADSGWTHKAGSNLDLESDGGIDISGSSGVAMKAPKVDYKA